jgi:hypothetical protein
MPIFKLLDTLSGMEGLQLSALVGEILNNNRPASSSLGFRVASASKQSQVRNIAA